ncbi:MAG: aspartate kinase [Desulfobacteraceae bacterium]|nr:MAG: aspartate kinase [Desulfobacteraceae bacterium]
MKVIKIGGGCLKNGKAARAIVDLIAQKGLGQIFVLSAFGGITDMLIHGIDTALQNEAGIVPTIEEMTQHHHHIIDELMDVTPHAGQLKEELESFFLTLERYYYGISFTREATPRMKDIIASYGERISAVIISRVLESRGCRSEFLMPDVAGIITDGKYMDATADMTRTRDNLYPLIRSIMDERKMLFIPGFFGKSRDGEITTFGRGGSDYSAAVVAAAVDAEVLEIWKDTEGFMTADPDNIPDCRLIPELTYEEAAELSYTGAGILHARTVEPARKAGIGISIRNTFNPEAPGSMITDHARTTDRVIKSVSYTTDISVLKIFASGVGARYGILSQITDTLARDAVNIKSVVTSQTGISLLLARDDLDRSFNALKQVKPRPFRKMQKVSGVALVSIVGEGLHRNRGIAAKCFTAVSQAKVNIEMISFGTSNAALYFLVKERDLDQTINSLHSTFFD